MRTFYLESLRMLLNTVICILLFAAGLEGDNIYLQIIAVLMYVSKLVASTERRTTWNATNKKSSYREKYPRRN